MILRLTTKLGKKIGLVPTQTLAPDENPFIDWVGNLFIAGRIQYIILSNTASLYSIIMPGRGITDDNAFLSQSISAMRDFMQDDGHESIFKDLIAPYAGIIRYSKTSNYSVLGSMNDFINNAGYIWLNVRCRRLKRLR